jgi:hypothetical protein
MCNIYGYLVHGMVLQIINGGIVLQCCATLPRRINTSWHCYSTETARLKRWYLLTAVSSGGWRLILQIFVRPDYFCKILKNKYKIVIATILIVHAWYVVSVLTTNNNFNNNHQYNPLAFQNLLSKADLYGSNYHFSIFYYIWHFSK